MLKAKAIPRVLEQIHRDGIESSLLMLDDGSLLGAAKQPFAKTSSSEVQAAILSNLWSDYQRAGSRIQGGALDMLVLNCEAGRIGAMRLREGFIIAAAGKDASTRVLREELGRLRDALAPVLATLDSDDDPTAGAAPGAGAAGSASSGHP